MPINSRPPNVTVLGSINQDLVVHCDDLPLPGQTILAKSFAEHSGGKGANQAVAAALAGGRVRMIGAVGDDAFADRLIANLNRHGIDTESVLRRKNTSSGLAVIAVDRRGENSIMVIPGANATLSASDVIAKREVIEQADVVMVQLELPIATVLAGTQIARGAGVRVMLDPAPVPRDVPDQLFDVDVLCPNENEATELTGISVTDWSSAKDAAETMRGRGVRRVLLTMGRQGTLLDQADGHQSIEAFEVNTVDTTAAGDAFAGAFAVAWAESEDVAAAVRFGNAAGALAASRHGAQDSLATREQIESLLETRR